MTTWVYISGRGHSGSTMLDAMLGNAAKLESVGELVAGMGRYESLCSCGSSFADCAYWQAVRNRFETLTGEHWDAAVTSTAGQAHVKNFLKTLLAGQNTDWVIRLKRHSHALADAVAVAPAEAIVDSSKEITRALFLLRFIADSRVIHLVRHPANILQSQYYRLQTGSGFKFLRRTYRPGKIFAPFLLLGCVGWIVGNILSEIVRLYGRDRFLVVRYEDIIRHPVEQIDRIEEFIGLSLDRVRRQLQDNEAFKIGHNIGGNHMRMSGEFVIEANKSSRAGLPARYHWLVNILCYPLLKRYGY